MKEIGEKKAALTGIGRSEIGRRLGKDPLALTVEACLAAIADAGLTRADIDGVATYPGSATMGPPGTAVRIAPGLLVLAATVRVLVARS